MSLFERLAKIAMTSVDEFVRAMEGDLDEGVVEVPVSDFERALQEARKSAAKCEMSFRRMEAERDQLLREIQDLNEQAASRLTEGCENEARAALEKKVHLESRVFKLQPAIEESRKTAEGLKNELRKIKAGLDEANRRMADLETRKRAADAREALEKLREQLNKDEDLEEEKDALLKREVELELEKQLRDLEEPGAEFDRIGLNVKLDAQIEALRREIDSEREERSS